MNDTPDEKSKTTALCAEIHLDIRMYSIVWLCVAKVLL